MRDKLAASKVLFHWGDDASLAVLRRLALADPEAVPHDIALAVFMKGDPATAVAALSPRFLNGGVIRYRICEQLTPHADPRWLPLARGLVADDPGSAFDALLALGDVETVLLAARSDTLDVITKQALHALGQRAEGRAAPLLRGWLTRAEGKPVAPMLLAALGGCGSVDDVGFLEGRLASGDATPHEAFYRHAIERLRARV